MANQSTTKAKGTRELPVILIMRHQYIHFNYQIIMIFWDVEKLELTPRTHMIQTSIIPWTKNKASCFYSFLKTYANIFSIPQLFISKEFPDESQNSMVICIRAHSDFTYINTKLQATQISINNEKYSFIFYIYTKDTCLKIKIVQFKIFIKLYG